MSAAVEIIAVAACKIYSISAMNGLPALGSMQTFVLLPPVLKQSFTNDGNADLVPKYDPLKV